MKIKSLFMSLDVTALRLLSVMVLMFSLITACSKTTSEEYLERARLGLDKKEFQAAVINLKNALQQNPKNTQARYLLGKTYIKLGNGAGAEKELEAAQRLGLSSDLLAIPLGRAYLLLGKSKKLLEELKLESGFSNQLRAEIFALKAQAHLALGETDNARNLLNSALQEDPESLSALLVKARVAVLQGDFVLSQQLVDRVVNKQPANLEAWLIAGEIARLKGDFIAAKKNYDKALELESANLLALLGKASVSIATGDYQSALQSAEDIQRRSPQHPLANYVRAVVLYKQKDTEGAEEALQEVLKVAPGHLPSQQMLGSIYFANGRFEQARVSLEKVVNAFPNNLAVRKLLASTWLKLGQPEFAIELLEKALPVNEADPQLLALLGSAYMQSKNAAKGTEYLERAVAQSPDNASIQTQLALGRLAAGKTAEAVEALETAVELGQGVFQADVLLALTHIRSKEFTKALEKARQLALKLPDSAVPDNLAGAAYVALGDKRAARESFEKALKIQPDFVPAAMNLARLDEQEGDIKSARIRLEQLVTQNKGYVKAILALASIAEREGDQAKVAKWLDQAWEQNAGNLQVGTLLVRYWVGRREFTKAVDIAREMKAQNPEDFAALRAYGVAQLAAGQQSGALQTFSSLAEHHADVAAAHYLLGKAYIATDDLALAEQHLNKALNLDAKFVPAQLTLAQLVAKNGNLDKALRIARKIQKQRPLLGAGYQLEGNLQMQAKDPAAAAKVYAKGFARVPSATLAMQHFQADRKHRAKQADTSLLVEWLGQHPNDIRVRLVLAQAYTEAGKKQNAATQYKKILESSPKNVAALNNLAWLYYELGRKDALSYGQKAQDLAPGNPAVNDTYGWLLVQSGKSKQGLRYLQNAFQKAPNVAKIQFHYAVALERNGQTQRAREELEKLLAKHSDFSEAAEAKAMLSKMR